MNGPTFYKTIMESVRTFNDAEDDETRYSAAERIDNMMQTLRHRPLPRNPNFCENAPVGVKDRIQYFVSLFRPELSPVVRDIFNSTLRVPFDTIEQAMHKMMNTYLNKNKEYILYSYLPMGKSVAMFNLYYLKFLLDIGVRVRYICMPDSMPEFDIDYSDYELIVIDDISYSGTQLAEGINELFELNTHTNVFVYGLTGAAIRFINTPQRCTVHAEKFLYSPLLYIRDVFENRNNITFPSNIVIRDKQSVVEYREKSKHTRQVVRTAQSSNNALFANFVDFYKPHEVSLSSNTMIYLNYKMPDDVSINRIMYGEIEENMIASDADMSQLVKLNKCVYFYPIIYPHMYDGTEFCRGQNKNECDRYAFTRYKERVEKFSRPWYKYINLY